MALSARVEDYLEAALKIEMAGGVATVTQLADSLSVTKATVTAALKRLREAGLLEHERYGSVRLTAEGREKGLAVHRRHEFLTDFFVTILGLTREKAESVSCVMEHEIDEESERRFAAFTDGMMRAEREDKRWLSILKESLESPGELPVPLCMLGEGDTGTISRITAQEGLKKRLRDLGFLHGAEVTNEGSRGRLRMRLSVDGVEREIEFSDAAVIWLRLSGTDT